MERGYDVVYAQRANRDGETPLKRAIAYMGYRLIDGMSKAIEFLGYSDFRLMSRRVVTEVLNLKESHGFLRGMVALVGFRQISVPFSRPARCAGLGHYNRLWDLYASD